MTILRSATLARVTTYVHGLGHAACGVFAGYWRCAVTGQTGTIGFCPPGADE
jgi:hypothetical protein